MQTCFICEIPEAFMQQVSNKHICYKCLNDLREALEKL